MTDRTQKRTVSGQEIEYRFRYQIEESRVMISAETGVCEETVRWVIPVVGKHEAGVERLKDSENGRETGVKSCSIITHGNDVDYGLKKRTGISASGTGQETCRDKSHFLSERGLRGLGGDSKYGAGKGEQVLDQCGRIRKNKKQDKKADQMYRAFDLLPF